MIARLHHQRFTNVERDALDTWIALTFMGFTKSIYNNGYEVRDCYAWELDPSEDEIPKGGPFRHVDIDDWRPSYNSAPSDQMKIILDRCRKLGLQEKIMREVEEYGVSGFDILTLTHKYRAHFLSIIKKVYEAIKKEG